MTQPSNSAGESFLDKAAKPFEKFTPEGPKKWVVALVLAFFVGWLGVHNFYLGYTKNGVIQLGLSVIGMVTSIIFIGSFILMAVGVWALVQFVMILLGKGSMAHDADGVPLER